MNAQNSGFDPIHLEDVAAGLSSCLAAFAQLAALLKVIQTQSPKHSDAAKLAALGWSVACDMGEFAGCTLEQLQKGGLQQ